MLYAAAEVTLLLVLSGGIGLAIGYAIWGRGNTSVPSDDADALQRQLAATRKRAAAAEAEVAKRAETMKDAASAFKDQRRRIRELEAENGTDSSDSST